ncbi:unnamed protein product, partial [Schistosoma turkestanicum]
QSPVICRTKLLSPLENQMCCLSRQISDQTIGKKNFKQLAADINGLMLSYSHYKDLLTTGDNNLENMKSFFETFAITMCEDSSHDLIGLRSSSFQQYHEFSVNDILRNSEEFSKIYQCPRGSKMNPVNQCTF